jgi:hypothetical protein
MTLGIVRTIAALAARSILPALLPGPLPAGVALTAQVGDQLTILCRSMRRPSASASSVRSGGSRSLGGPPW